MASMSFKVGRACLSAPSDHHPKRRAGTNALPDHGPNAPILVGALHEPTHRAGGSPARLAATSEGAASRPRSSRAGSRSNACAKQLEDLIPGVTLKRMRRLYNILFVGTFLVAIFF